jgi:tetratricopeptide (TPR) repeat protein
VKPQHRLRLLLLYGQVLLVDHLLTLGGGNADLLFSTILNARQVAEASHAKLGIADALSLLGRAHYFTAVVSGAVMDNPQSGRYNEALAYQQQALEMREALHDTRGISESFFQIGVVHERWQQYDRAEEYYTKARQITQAQLIPKPPEHDEQDDIGGVFQRVERGPGRSLKMRRQAEQQNVR